MDLRPRVYDASFDVLELEKILFAVRHELIHRSKQDQGIEPGVEAISNFFMRNEILLHISAKLDTVFMKDQNNFETVLRENLSYDGPKE